MALQRIMIMGTVTITVSEMGTPTVRTMSIRKGSEASSIDCSCRTLMIRTTPSMTR
jgi:hypothetical protein